MIMDKSSMDCENRLYQSSHSNTVNNLTLLKINERMDDAIKRGHIDFMKDLARNPKKKYYWQ